LRRGNCGLLIGALEAPFAVQGHGVAIGASVGIARFPDDAPDADVLLRRADSAMYQAKRTGGGVCRYRLPASDQFAA
jgi:predicted signal transduction protein with EAL and GGDEF domain